MFANVMRKIQSVIAHQELQPNLGWMDTLSEMGELEALLETKAQLAKLDFTTAEHMANKLDWVLEIDEKTFQNVKKITHKYLNNLKINRELQAEIQNAVHLYQRQLYVAYTQFFDVYQNQNKLKISDAKMHLVLARLLNAAFVMAKWRYFDDQPAPAGTWSNVHKVIKTAENMALMNTNLFLYDVYVKETSIASILKRGFMMDTLQKGNFSRLQIQLTEQVLKIWASNPLIVNSYKQDRYQFFIALEGDRGPERVRSIEKYTEYRYWKTTRLVDLIEDYLCAVDTGKPLEKFGLDKIAPASVLVKLFKKLRTEWCVEGYSRQRRKEVRNKNHKVLSISQGLHPIYTRLNALKQNHTPKFVPEDDFTFELKVAPQRDKPGIANPSRLLGEEKWLLVDESVGGLAVDLGRDIGDWIEVGRLVAYAPQEDPLSISVAEIKSLKKQANGTYRAGLQLIANNAVAQMVSRVEKETRTEAAEGYFVADFNPQYSHFKAFESLLIEGANGFSMVMPRSEYKRAGEYRVTISGDEKIARAGRLLSKQRDWVRLEMLV